MKIRYQRKCIALLSTLLEYITEYDCLVFCILTHGGDCGILYGTDGRPVHIHKITELFHYNRCANLAGKPKLFFIQACQGVLNQTGILIMAVVVTQ